MVDPTVDIGSQDNWVLTKEQTSQTEFLQAQKSLSSLQGQAPADLSQVDVLLNKAVSDEVSGINNIVTAVKNSLAVVNDLTYLDPDVAGQAFTSLQQGATEGNQALSLIAASTAAILLSKLHKTGTAKN